MRKKQVILFILFFTITSLLSFYMSSIKFKESLHKVAHFIYNDPASVEILNFLSKTPYHNLIKPTNTRSEYILSLYQIMKDVHDTFKELRLEYWVDGGTLLGVIRNGGIIPWDDDIDLDIHSINQQKFEQCAIPVLKNLGYNISNKNGQFKITANHNSIKLEENELLPACDIFIASEKNGELLLKGWKSAIKVKHWKPLKQYKFGPIMVWGNADPVLYLIDLYGANWQQLGVRGSDHRTIDSKDSSGMPFILKDIDYKPAEFDGLIIDNSKQIKIYIDRMLDMCTKQEKNPNFNESTFP